MRQFLISGAVFGHWSQVFEADNDAEARQVAETWLDTADGDPGALENPDATVDAVVVIPSA